MTSRMTQSRFVQDEQLTVGSACTSAGRLAWRSTQAARCNRSTCRSQCAARFQLPLLWSTISKSLILND